MTELRLRAEEALAEARILLAAGRPDGAISHYDGPRLTAEDAGKAVDFAERLLLTAARFVTGSSDPAESADDPPS